MVIVKIHLLRRKFNILYTLLRIYYSELHRFRFNYTSNHWNDTLMDLCQESGHSLKRKSSFVSVIIPLFFEVYFFFVNFPLRMPYQRTIFSHWIWLIGGRSRIINQTHYTVTPFG